MRVYRTWIKPSIDKVVALLILLISSPVLLITMGILAVANRGTPWFLQVRPGKEGRLFEVIKFKTMSDTRDQNGVLLPDDVRLTRAGQWVRKLSLDELPQLINVLKGDMSIVGPRPLLPEYLPLYNARQKRRHEVRPGITGWAQVNGRNKVPWPERFEMDVWYVENQSLALDLKILLLTVAKVLRAEGISGDNTTTMEKFRGNA